MAKDVFDEVTGELISMPPSFYGYVDPEIVAKFGVMLRTGYNYDRDQASADTALACNDPSLAQQHMADDADINTIVKRFGLTGQLPENVRLPEYGDFTGINDYASALRALSEADENFLEIPAELRARFHNSPQRFLEFVENPTNLEELYSLGLAVRPSGGEQPSRDAPTAQPNASPQGNATP
jgi:phage internal scaffolding protein